MVLLYYLRHHFKPDIYGQGYRGLIKQGLHENPWMTISILLLPTTFLFIPYIVWRNRQMGGDKRRFMMDYTIYRPGDHRLQYYSKVIDRTKKSNNS